MTTVQLTPLNTAIMPAPARFFSRPPGPLSLVRGLLGPGTKHRLPIPVFLLEHPTEGPVLVDTGITPAGAAKLPAYGRPFMPTQEVVPAAEQLRARGIDPADVRTIVMTHLHFDHLAGALDFPRARFLVSRTELAHARSKGVLDGYLGALIDPVDTWEELDIAPGAEHDIFGDGSVRMWATPGHSPGHCSVLVATDEGGVLLTGDAAYRPATIEERLVPLFVDDIPTYLHSLDAIRSRVVDRVYCGHDPEMKFPSQAQPPPPG